MDNTLILSVYPSKSRKRGDRGWGCGEGGESCPAELGLFCHRECSSSILSTAYLILILRFQPTN